MAAFRFRRRRTRRLWFGATTSALAAVLLLIVASASGNLAGSTFEGNDGNLVVNTPGNHDWDNAPDLHVGVDLASGQTDNSFGQGTQENDVNVTVVTGSIPNSKADLARFAVASEFVNGSNFVYLAWTRENLGGTVNFDFEINQKTQPNLTTAGPKTLIRTAGDLLINYAFQGGSNTPTLTLRTWTGSVWGAEQSLTGSSEGATNSATVADTLASPSVNRPPQAFGEAAVNLTAAGVFPPGTCEAFGSAFVKSRASTSFNSEIKDFIAPVAVNISNCGTVNIHKQDDVGAPLAGAVFTLFKDNAPVDGAPPHGAEDTAVPTYTCTTDASGNCTIQNVFFGDYWAVETTGVPGHDLAPDQSFSLTQSTPALTISLTFVDPRQPGAILITKTAKNHNLGPGQHPLAGATFEVTDSGNNIVGGGTTLVDGTVCVDNLAQGATYTVTETGAPLGYSIDTASQQVTINTVATCSSGTPNSVTFTDTPLSTITVGFHSLAGAGVTAATVQCTGEASPSPLAEGDATHTLGDGTATLTPGTYTCTVVVDP